MRGSDIDYNPVFFSYAIITLDDVRYITLTIVWAYRPQSTIFDLFRLYLFEDRITSTTISEHLPGVTLLPYSQMTSDLQELIKNKGKIWISKQASHALVKCVPKSQLCSLLSPIQLLKSIKNETEIQGMRTCQVKYLASS